MPTVVLADDHALVRQGIQALLERSGDITVIGEASDGIQAIAVVERLKPDVLLIDLSMPNLNGLEALQRISATSTRTRIIVVSIHADEVIVMRALRAGAKGYLLKHSFKEELFLAINAVARGEIYLASQLTTLVLHDLISGTKSRDDRDPLDRLSSREREVFQLILEGQSNRQIANSLKISVKTVDKHRTNLMKKLDVHDVTGLMHIAIQHGLLYVR